jgi:hypothetical protein
MIPDNLLPEFKSYCRIVDRLTRTSISKKYSKEDLKNRGRSGNKNSVQIDHKISKHFGFLHQIPPEMISHPCNLDLVLSDENNKKHTSCNLSIEELNLFIEQYKINSK